MDAVFKALADPTRRFLLDQLRQRNGQTLGELCERVAMARQSATQHLGVLEAANLISTVRQGRQKLHYLNPVPLHEIQERWIDTFEVPRLRAVSAIRRRAEENMSDRPAFVYVTYIAGTAEKVWRALTDAVEVSEAPHRLVTLWAAPDGSGETSRVTFTLQQDGGVVRLTVTHENLAGEAEREAAASGWSAVLSNLKTLLKTGHTLPRTPWDMP